eukprot:SAG11_NODE_4677_length_1809_cov_1.292811_1_plen_119_part_00
MLPCPLFHECGRVLPEPEVIKLLDSTALATFVIGKVRATMMDTHGTPSAAAAAAPEGEVPAIVAVAAAVDALFAQCDTDNSDALDVAELAVLIERGRVVTHSIFWVPSVVSVVLPLES